MHKSKNALLRPGGGAWRARAAAIIRPSIEAALLAAVALGVAQTGWGVVAPSNAGASGAADTAAPPATTPMTADVRSPFAPLSNVDAATQAEAALLSSVQLSGLRMSSDPARSGAVLTLEDGAQRAFSVGEDIAPGVRLSEVRADYVLISFSGGQKQLTMSGAAPSFSYARAMMGESQSATESSEPVAAAAAPTNQATAQMSADEASWLAGALAHVEQQNGQPLGWRVAGPLPAQLAAAGLKEGDLILSINGAGPANLIAALGAARATHIELAVERGADQRLNITLSQAEPT